MHTKQVILVLTAGAAGATGAGAELAVTGEDEVCCVERKRKGPTWPAVRSACVSE